MKQVFAAVVSLFVLSSALQAAKEPPKNEAQASANKETYLNKADREVQEWTAKLKSLEERSEASGAKSREELDRRIKVVDDNLAAARKKLDELHTSSAGAWDTLRHGFDETLEKVKHDYQKALSYFNKNEKKGGKGDKEKKS